MKNDLQCELYENVISNKMWWSKRYGKYINETNDTTAFHIATVQSQLTWTVRFLKKNFWRQPYDYAKTWTQLLRFRLSHRAAVAWKDQVWIPYQKLYVIRLVKLIWAGEKAHAKALSAWNADSRKDKRKYARTYTKKKCAYKHAQESLLPTSTRTSLGSHR